MPLFRLNGKQEQLLFYLYELRNSSERGVPPDPRVTLHGIASGTGLPLADVANLVERLKEKALVRSVKIGPKCYHHLTLKSENELGKVQQRVIKLGFNNFGVHGEYKKKETNRGEE
jgi:hypothetical protein